MKTTSKIILAIVAIAIIIGGVAGYIYLSQPSGGEETVLLGGSGATFPVPLLDAMITEYATVKPNVLINYEGIGSGGGISALQAKTVDFAGSDAPLKEAERELAPNEEIGIVIHDPALSQ